MFVGGPSLLVRYLKAVSEVACPQGIEGSGMAGRGET
jgi:hypothetical protein